DCRVKNSKRNRRDGLSICLNINIQQVDGACMLIVMEQSRVALPETGYLARIGESAYTVSSMEWTILGDLKRLAEILPEEIVLKNLEPMTTSEIAESIKSAAHKVDDAPTKDYL